MMWFGKDELLVHKNGHSISENLTGTLIGIVRKMDIHFSEKWTLDIGLFEKWTMGTGPSLPGPYFFSF